MKVEDTLRGNGLDMTIRNTVFVGNMAGNQVRDHCVLAV